MAMMLDLDEFLMPSPASFIIMPGSSSPTSLDDQQTLLSSPLNQQAYSSMFQQQCVGGDINDTPASIICAKAGGGGGGGGNGGGNVSGNDMVDDDEGMGFLLGFDSASPSSTSTSSTFNPFVGNSDPNPNPNHNHHHHNNNNHSDSDAAISLSSSSPSLSSVSSPEHTLLCPDACSLDSLLLLNSTNNNNNVLAPDMLADPCSPSSSSSFSMMTDLFSSTVVPGPISTDGIITTTACWMDYKGNSCSANDEVASSSASSPLSTLSSSSASPRSQSSSSSSSSPPPPPYSLSQSLSTLSHSDQKDKKKSASSNHQSQHSASASSPSPAPSNTKKKRSHNDNDNDNIIIINNNNNNKRKREEKSKPLSDSSSCSSSSGGEQSGIEAKPSSGNPEEDVKEAKRVRRLMKNRESAQASRERKRQYVENLEKRVSHLTGQANGLTNRVCTLENENIALRERLRQLEEEAKHESTTATSNSSQTSQQQPPCAAVSTAAKITPTRRNTTMPTPKLPLPPLRSNKNSSARVPPSFFGQYAPRFINGTLSVPLNQIPPASTIARNAAKATMLCIVLFAVAFMITNSGTSGGSDSIDIDRAVNEAAAAAAAATTTTTSTTRASSATLGAESKDLPHVRIGGRILHDFVAPSEEQLRLAQRALDDVFSSVMSGMGMEDDNIIFSDNDTENADTDMIIDPATTTTTTTSPVGDNCLPSVKLEETNRQHRSRDMKMEIETDHHIKLSSNDAKLHPLPETATLCSNSGGVSNADDSSGSIPLISITIDPSDGTISKNSNQSLPAVLVASYVRNQDNPDHNQINIKVEEQRV